MLVRAQRSLKPEGVTGLQLAWDITLRTRPAWDLEPWLLGEPLPFRRGAYNEPRRRRPDK